MPAPGTIRVASHPPGVGAIRPIVPPVVPLAGIEAAIAVEIAIVIVPGIAVCSRIASVDAYLHTAVVTNILGRCRQPHRSADDEPKLAVLKLCACAGKARSVAANAAKPSEMCMRLLLFVKTVANCVANARGPSAL